MNNDPRPIKNYDELLLEKHRLEGLIEIQKNIIRHDLDELKAEFKKEIKPATDVASFIQKVALPERRKQTFLSVGAGIAIDTVFRSVFGKSNFILRLIVPKVLKKYTQSLLSSKSRAI